LRILSCEAIVFLLPEQTLNILDLP